MVRFAVRSWVLLLRPRRRPCASRAIWPSVNITWWRPAACVSAAPIRLASASLPDVEHYRPGKVNMPSQPDTQRFLVKVQPGLGPALALAAGPNQFKLEPLFTSIGQSPGGALAATVAPAWHILTPPEPAGETHPWDACHQLVHDGFGIAGAPAPEFAEPDIQQQWFVAPPATLAQALANTCATINQQDSNFPVQPENLWFHDNAHGQFADALAAIGQPDPANTVRVAHCDTGYYADHHALPANLNHT